MLDLDDGLLACSVFEVVVSQRRDLAWARNVKYSR